MSYSWSFHSFSDEAFRDIFGRSSPQKVGEFLKSAEYALGDLSPEISHASRSMLMSGISYDGLSPDASRAMDEVIKLAFSPEGLEAELAVEHLSPDGIHPSVIDELVRRLDAPAPLLAASYGGGVSARPSLPIASIASFGRGMFRQFFTRFVMPAPLMSPSRPATCRNSFRKVSLSL